MNINNQQYNTLPIAEEFYSVQGEGFNAGQPAYFVRVAGCDVCCPFCDSNYTWKTSNFEQVNVVDIADRALQSGLQNVVITGGEPLLYDLNTICDELHKRNLKIWLETSGAHPLSGNFDWICVSPKQKHLPDDEFFLNANELKVVISNKNDFDLAISYAKKVTNNCVLFLQAEWNNRNSVYPQIFDFVLKNPRWRISIQTHKILNIQ